MLRVIDFGLARELGGMDKVKCAMVGTLEFMAPEVVKCTFASPASDMWSLGVVLMMMVSGGISPFWAGSDIATQRRVVRSPLSPYSSLNCLCQMMLLSTKLQSFCLL